MRPRPSYALGLQVGLFAPLARVGARLLAAKKGVRAWLPRNVTRVHFLVARLCGAQAGDFGRLPHLDGVAAAGSLGKVKLPHGREGESVKIPLRLYMAMTLPLSPSSRWLLFLHLPRERSEASSCCESWWHPSPVDFFYVHCFGASSPRSCFAWCRDSELWASSSSPTDLLPLLQICFLYF